MQEMGSGLLLQEMGSKWGQVCCWLLNDFCYLASHVPTIDWYRIFANTGV
jgi:hypothetical protein